MLRCYIVEIPLTDVPNREEFAQLHYAGLALLRCCDATRHEVAVQVGVHAGFAATAGCLARDTLIPDAVQHLLAPITRVSPASKSGKRTYEVEVELSRPLSDFERRDLAMLAMAAGMDSGVWSGDLTWTIRLYANDAVAATRSATGLLYTAAGSDLDIRVTAATPTSRTTTPAVA